MSSLYFKDDKLAEEELRVGDPVEVFCDHDNEDGDRIRDWLKGVVVQIDPKIVAVQLTENVYLTDGWMVPDHVLWCPKNSSNLRKAREIRRKKRE